MIGSLTRSSLANKKQYRSLLAGNEPVSYGAYELISTVILTSATNTITFSSIPQTYAHLQLRVVGIADGGGNIRLNDAFQTHQEHLLQANGSAVGSGNAYVYTYLRALNLATDNLSMFGAGIVDIPFYSLSGRKPVIKSLTGYRHGGAGQVTLLSGFNPNSTGPITSMSILGTNFYPGSRFSLYGIKG